MRPMDWLRIALAILVMPAAATGESLAQSPQPNSGLVIRDVTLISPERSAPLAHAFVRVENGRIAEVSATPLDGDEVIDGRGRFLIPGLIDTHVHPRWIPGLDESHRARYPQVVAAADAQEPRSYLYHGFTTILSLGGATEPLIRRWNALDVRPDALFCGGTPMFRGYSFRGVEGSPYFLLDPKHPGELPKSIDPRNHTPEAVVARMAKDGAVCVKVYYERGFGERSNLPVASLDMLRRLIAAAHARNMPVFMHANDREEQEVAVQAGVDVIAHGMWTGHELAKGAVESPVAAGTAGTTQLAKRPSDAQLAEGVRQLAREIARRRIGYQPTSQVIRGLQPLFEADFLSRPALKNVYPAALLDFYRSDEGAWYAEELSSWFRSDRGQIAMYEQLVARGEAVLTSLARQNARLLFGTDTPSQPTYGNPPGLNGYWEMRNWIASGVTLRQLLHAATLENARILRKEKELGTIEKGKIAHMLLLRADPLKSVEAYDQIETVFLAGRRLERETLSVSRRTTRR